MQCLSFSVKKSLEGFWFLYLFSEESFDWYPLYLHILQAQAPQLNWTAYVVQGKCLQYWLEKSGECTIQHFSMWYISVLIFPFFWQLNEIIFCVLSIFSLYGSLHCDFRRILCLDFILETRERCGKIISPWKMCGHADQYSSCAGCWFHSKGLVLHLLY